jgi:hypothetical protein
VEAVLLLRLELVSPWLIYIPGILYSVPMEQIVQRAFGAMSITALEYRQQRVWPRRLLQKQLSQRLVRLRAALLPIVISI